MPIADDRWRTACRNENVVFLLLLSNQLVVPPILKTTDNDSDWTFAA